MARRRDHAVLRNRPLTFPEILSVTLGERPNYPVFASDQDRRQAWEQHRESMIARCALGKRPVAYWEYEGSPELRYEPHAYRPTGPWAVLMEQSPYICLPWDPGWLAEREARRTVREGRWAWILAHDAREGEAAAILEARREQERRDASELERMEICVRLARQRGVNLPEPTDPHDGGDHWEEA